MSFMSSISFKSKTFNFTMEGIGIENSDVTALNLVVSIAELPTNPFRKSRWYANRKDAARFYDAANLAQKISIFRDMFEHFRAYDFRKALVTKG